MRNGRFAGLFPPVVLLLLWQTAALILRTPLLPGPAAVIGNIFFSRGLILNLLSSFLRIFASLSAALLIGLPLGIAAGRKHVLDAIFSPFAFFFHPLPKTLFIPPVLFLFGVGEISKILLVFLSVFFAVILAVRDAVKAVDPKYIISIRSMGGRPSDILRFVVIPAVLPSLFSVIRISLGIAAAVLFFAEYFGTSVGMGWFIMDSVVRMDYTDLYTGIAVFSMLLFVLYFLLDRLEKKVCPWGLPAVR